MPTDRLRLTPFVLAILALAAVAAYLPVWQAGFVYEDVNWQASAAGFQWTQLWTAWSYRLIPDPRWGHLLNVAIHLGNGLLVFGVASLWELSTPVAIIAAGLFWWHPLGSEAVSYLSGRGDLLTCMGALVAVAGVSRLSRQSAGWGWAAFVGGLILAAGAKWSALAVVPVLFWVVFVWGGLSRERFAAVLGVVAVVLLVALQRPAFTAQLSGLAWDRLYAGQQAYALLRMGSLFLVPIGFTVDHDFGAVSLLMGGVSLAVIGASCWVLWAWRETQPIAAAGLGWALLMLLPRLVTASLYAPALPSYVTEAHAYACLPGFCFAAAPLLERVWCGLSVPSRSVEWL